MSDHLLNKYSSNWIVKYGTFSNNLHDIQENIRKCDLKDVNLSAIKCSVWKITK